MRPSLIADIPKNIRTNEAEEAVEVKPRNPKDDPTQVQLVELLQFVRYLRNDQKLNLTIVISAWDLLEAQSHKWKPQDLVKKELPLLWQYAKSNSDIFSVMYYGVSAQGGKLNETDRLL